MLNKNYQKELEKIIQTLRKEQKIPTLFLHSCCAPCSSYCLEYLAEYFSITIFYYNPNITDMDEYRRRVEEQKKLIGGLAVKYPVSFQEGPYEPERFFAIAKGYEKMEEGGERCFRCYALRLDEAAKMASLQKFDYFTTTLSISPHKNANILNEIGQEIGKNHNIKHLPSDFKKKNGYKRSIELSKEYDLYRQSYCGCVFSKQRIGTEYM